MPAMKDTPLVKAIQKAGGVAAFAKALGVSSQNISQWRRCPPGRCLEVEALTGVSRHDLRPDIYGEKPSRKKAA